MREDLGYWLAFVRFGSFGSVRLQKLARWFPTMKHAFESGHSSLLESGMESNTIHRFLQERMHLDPHAELERLAQAQTKAITILDSDYPPLLKTLYDPPALLFVRGTLPDPARKHLAVVGSRKQSNYGNDVTHFLIEPMARAGIVIVSGLAYGIDACAHQVCLDAGGTTVAVLGSGVDTESIYPSGNRALASHILSHNGAIISEFPIGTNPQKHHFPIRNRIIAGLSHGTLVVEASIKSGSLITARCALEAGKDVYAVPGPIQSPLSEGPNNLIKMGAIPVTKASDFFGMESLETLATNTPSYEPATEEERGVLAVMNRTPYHMDEIVSRSQMAPAAVNKIMTILEMKGAIRHDGGQYYSLV